MLTVVLSGLCNYGYLIFFFMPYYIFYVLYDEQLKIRGKKVGYV